MADVEAIDRYPIATLLTPLAVENVPNASDLAADAVAESPIAIAFVPVALGWAFDAAFGGAAAVGVQTFTPSQSQTLSGLLAVHDWLHPTAPRPGKISVHGGIHTLPYPMDIALRVRLLLASLNHQNYSVVY